MSILHVPVTFANLAEWVRRAAQAINQLITGKQDKDDNLTSLAELGLTGGELKIAVVNAAEDGFELADPLASYTVATLPAATGPKRLIYVSDESGGAVPAFNDGTDWRRVTDRAVVS